ncbi:MAG: hypothetical protein LKG24_00430 [Lacticaseibacillus songhuajiangensis]|nr:hypothetical protein [Lacticaseibacillus songhuajiangensis]
MALVITLAACSKTSEKKSSTSSNAVFQLVEEGIGVEEEGRRRKKAASESKASSQAASESGAKAQSESRAVASSSSARAASSSSAAASSPASSQAAAVSSSRAAVTSSTNTSGAKAAASAINWDDYTLTSFVNKYGVSPALYMIQHYGMSKKDALNSVPERLLTSGEMQTQYQLNNSNWKKK